VKKIHEVFHVFSPEKPATLTVSTEAEGLYAEQLRSSTADVTQDELQKNYLNYYARQYPGISVAKPFEIRDEPDNNRFVTMESYEIKDFWPAGSDKSERECEFYPQTISDLLIRPDTTLRSMPLDIPYPRHETLRTEVLLPEPWEIESTNEFFGNTAFNLNYRCSYSKNTLLMDYDFRTTTNCVLPRDMPAYLKGLDRIQKNVGYSLTWPDHSFKGAELNWSIISLASVYSVLVLVGGFALYRTGRRPMEPGFELQPGSSDSHLNGLGGWLLLIGLSIVISPINILRGIAESASAYSLSSWHTLTNPSGGAYHSLWAPLLIFDLLANLTLLGCSILLVMLYFKKRRIFPKLYVAFLLSNAFILLADHFGTQLLDRQTSGIDDTRSVARALAACMIWIPYMLQSRRVKATFLR